MKRGTNFFIGKLHTQPVGSELKIHQFLLEEEVPFGSELISMKRGTIKNELQKIRSLISAGKNKNCQVISFTTLLMLWRS